MVDAIPPASDGGLSTGSTVSGDPRYAVLRIGYDLGVTAYGPYPSGQAAADACTLIKHRCPQTLALGFVKLTAPLPDPTSGIWPVAGGGVVTVPAVLATAIAARVDEELCGGRSDTGMATAWVMTSQPGSQRSTPAANAPVIGILIGPFASPSAVTDWIAAAGLADFPPQLGSIHVFVLRAAPEPGDGDRVDGTDVVDLDLVPDERDAVIVLVSHDPDSLYGTSYAEAIGPFTDALHASAYWHALTMFPWPTACLLPVDPPTGSDGDEIDVAACEVTDLRLPTSGTPDAAETHVVCSAHEENHSTATGWFHGLREVYSWHIRQTFPPGTRFVALPVRKPIDVPPANRP